MLEMIKLKNFQTHQSLRIDFDPHVTTIIGQTDVGKTSVLRALLWVSTNKPSGDDFVQWGTSAASVTLGVDGRRIRRQRGKGINTYSLDGHQFVSFGSGGVPEPISGLLNVGEVNFQSQHDAPFWFSLTPGQVSKELNQIINLNSIDGILADVASQLRKARAEAEVSANRLKSARESRDRLNYCTEMHEELTQLEHKSTAIEKNRARIASAALCVQNGELLAERVSNAADASVDAGKAIKLGTEAAETAKQQNRLHILIECTATMQEFATSAIPDIAELETIADQLYQTRSEANDIQFYAEQIESLEASLCKSEKLYTDEKKKLISQMKGKCPVCGRAV